MPGVDSSSQRGIQTAKAFGSNLTCIDIKDLGHGEGNIHSGKNIEYKITILSLPFLPLQKNCFLTPH